VDADAEIRRSRFAFWLAHVAASFVGVTALLVLGGWIVDVEILKNVTGLGTINANTAVCLLMCGVAVWALTDQAPSQTRHRSVAGGALPAGIEFLSKPFTAVALLGKVRAVLDARC